jgi:hypothetical protein
MQMVLLAWSVLQSIAILALFMQNRKERNELRIRTRTLDIRDELHQVVQQLNRKAIHDDQRLREAVEQLIARLEADPLTASRYMVDLTALKHKIR